MANADLDKQPDSVSSVLKVFGILQALGILSAIVGSMDIMAWFIPFLLFLGIATP